jgi:hypothetical protein
MDDYESNLFIEQAKAFDNKNTNLLKRKTDRELYKPQETIMYEKLQNGLSKPLDNKNKGHRLLLKLGYKEGEALGKNKTGICEPIDISKHIPSLKAKFDNVNRLSKEDEKYNILLDSKMSFFNEINNKLKKIIHQRETMIKNLDTLCNLYYLRYNIQDRFKKTIEIVEFQDERIYTYNGYYIPTLQRCISKLKITLEMFTNEAICLNCLPGCNCNYNKYQAFTDTKQTIDFNLTKFFRELIRLAEKSHIPECHNLIENFYTLLQQNNLEIKTYIRRNFLHCLTCSSDYLTFEEFDEHLKDCEINIE